MPLEMIMLPHHHQNKLYRLTRSLVPGMENLLLIFWSGKFKKLPKQVIAIILGCLPDDCNVYC